MKMNVFKYTGISLGILMASAQGVQADVFSTAWNFGEKVYANTIGYVVNNVERAVYHGLLLGYKLKMDKVGSCAEQFSRATADIKRGMFSAIEKCVKTYSDFDLYGCIVEKKYSDCALGAFYTCGGAALPYQEAAMSKAEKALEMCMAADTAREGLIKKIKESLGNSVAFIASGLYNWGDVIKAEVSGYKNRMAEAFWGATNIYENLPGNFSSGGLVSALQPFVVPAAVTVGTIVLSVGLYKLYKNRGKKYEHRMQAEVI